MRRIAFLLVFAMSLLGLAFRASAALVLPLYIDEGHTLLGALGVLHHGIPLLPSGVLYLHGATMSYLLAPFAALGWADLDHVGLLRTIPVLLGTAVVPVAAFLAFKIAPKWWVGVATAALVSLDALSIHWSAYVRMYPALQLITVGVALCVVILLNAPSNSLENRRAARWLVALIWIGVFTHLSAALFVPVIAILFAARWGLMIPRTNPPMARTLAACILAPVAHIGASSLIGNSTTREVTETSAWMSISFLGDHRVNFARLLSPDPGPWLNTFPGEPFGPLPALLLVAASAVVAYGVVRPANSAVWPRVAVLTLYWLPTLAFVLLTNAASPRYFVFVQPLGAILLSVAASDLVQAASHRRTMVRGLAAVTAAIAAAVFVIRDVDAIATVELWGPLGIGDQRSAIAKVASLRRPGDLVLNQTPALVYLGLGDISEARFLDRYDEPNEYARYVRFTVDGDPTDYWLGRPVIGTMPSLCQALADQPGSFLIMAEISTMPKHGGGWYGEMINMIKASTAEIYAADGVVVRRGMELGEWENFAIRTCDQYGLALREKRREKGKREKSERQVQAQGEAFSARPDTALAPRWARAWCSGDHFCA